METGTTSTTSVANNSSPTNHPEELPHQNSDKENNTNQKPSEIGYNVHQTQQSSDDDQDDTASDEALQMQPKSRRLPPPTTEETKTNSPDNNETNQRNRNTEDSSRINSEDTSGDESGEFQQRDGQSETKQNTEDKNVSDFLFKKKELKKPRTQSFQSVLSTASLKSLKQQFTNNPPSLHRNSSNAGNALIGAGNHKNFQSFIQAPVLSSVTNLRPGDDIQIGQQFPFNNEGDQNERQNQIAANPSAANSSNADTSKGQKLQDGGSGGEGQNDDDDYAEETILQQQRLTLNALKKLSLSLAPIIRSDDDETSENRQLTTRLLNLPKGDHLLLSRPMELRNSQENVNEGATKTKPYQPAQVDLSSFASLTRQSRYVPDNELPNNNRSQGQKVERNADLDTNEAQNVNAPLQLSLERDYHNDIRRQMLTMQDLNQNKSKGSTRPEISLSNGYHSSEPMHTGTMMRSVSHDEFPSQNGENVPNGSTNRLRSEKLLPQMDQYPVLPPTDMNVRNRNLSILKNPNSKPYPVSERKLQQIKGFRSPMYVPAVLRKTQDQDLGAISEGMEGAPELYFEGAVSQDQRPERTSSGQSIRSIDLSFSSDSFLSPNGVSNGVPYTLSKRQYEHIVKAAPTRKHWLRDESVAQCGIASCGRHFNFFERRHHCRRCGGIFCKEHTLHYLYINHLAQFTTGGQGTLSRVCDNCIQEYNEFMKYEFGVSCQLPKKPTKTTENSETDASGESSSYTPPPTNISNRSSKALDYRKEVLKYRADQTKVGPLDLSMARDEHLGDQLVGSVPANWSWSSF